MTSWNGFYGECTCKRCGTRLQGQGEGHPAESYAGTYNGLCDKCTHAGVFVEKVSPLDGAQMLNYPPDWGGRRDRVNFLAYEDCPECKGRGYRTVERSLGAGGNYRAYCRACTERYSNHPRRRARNDFQSKGLTLVRAYIERQYHADVRRIMGWRKSKQITARVMERAACTDAQVAAIHDMQAWWGRIYTVLVDKVNAVVERRFPEVWMDAILTPGGVYRGWGRNANQAASRNDRERP